MSSMTPAPARARAGRTGLGHTGPGRLRLTRRGRLVVLTLSVLAALAVVLFSLSGSATGSAQRGAPVPVRVVQVEAGDTLWSIATRVAPDEDPRDVVDEIQELNDVEGTLRVGTRLAVPLDR